MIVVVLLVYLLPKPKTSQLSAQVASNSIPIEGFSLADGSRPMQLPADFGPHEDFQTEWWYYTGNLDADDGRHFGYELTFFRVSLIPPDQTLPRVSDWATNQVYMAHFALTDVAKGEFHAFQRYSRGSGGLAGAEGNPYQVWLEDWAVQRTSEGEFALFAANEGLSVSLTLTDEKGPALHGQDGFSQKGPDPGNASYYYSQTRLATTGEIQVDNEVFAVTGLSWMDHEFSTNALGQGQVGWDWFAIQLDDGYEIMLYQIRQSDGSIDPFSSGTLIAPDGSTQGLLADDFIVRVEDSWRSPHSDAEYPMGWTIRIPEEAIELTLSPFLLDQELNLSTVYWEGAVQLSGQHNGTEVIGVGYVEMTGYAGSLGPGL
jgi:predicted secreted hydrolase